MEIAGLIWEYLGGTMRFLYGTAIRKLKLTKRKSYTYKEYLNGPDNSDDFDRIEHAFVNRVIGFLTTILLIFIMLYIGYLITGIQ